MAKFLSYYAAKQYGNKLNVDDFKEILLSEAKGKFNDKVLSADVDGLSKDELIRSLEDSIILKCVPDKMGLLDKVETEIVELEEYKRLTENNEMTKKIDANNKSSKVMDWTNVALSGASTLTSGISIGFSVAAINNVKEALENLEKCQKSLTELKTIFAEYNAEIEAEEGE